MIGSHVKLAFAAIFTATSIALQADTLGLLLPKPVKGERLAGSVTAEEVLRHIAGGEAR